MLIGVLAAIAPGALVSVLHAWLTITIRADQIISGTIINILALGLTGYLNRLIEPDRRRRDLRLLRSARGLVDLPVVGWIFNMFLNQGPIAMSVIVFVIVLQVLLFRSRWGLRTRAVGEHPRAADTVGIDVIAAPLPQRHPRRRLRRACGWLLTLEFNGSFQNGMTADRGFIALAAVIFGRWTPIGAFLGALLFMVSEALGVAIRSTRHPATWARRCRAPGGYPSLYNNFFAALHTSSRSSSSPAWWAGASPRPRSASRTTRKARH